MSKSQESDKEINYKGKILKISPSAKTKISVGEKSLHAEFNPTLGKFESILLPYQAFDTLEELGRSVVDNVHEFMNDDMKKKLRGEK